MKSDFTTIAGRLFEFISSSEGSGVSPCTSPAAADRSFNELALDLFGLQFGQNAPFRRLCEAREATPESVSHWTCIPAVPTAAFKEFELSCLIPGERTAVFHSSGSTGHRPSRHYHCGESLAIYEASLWAWFRRHILNGFPPTVGDWQLAVLTPPPGQVPHSSLAHMFETVRVRADADAGVFLGEVDAAGAWTLDFARTESALRAAIATGKPLVVLGTAFSHMHLLDALEDRDLRFKLPPGSVVMETGGYKGRSRELPKAELHELIERRLGVPASQIICEYGMSELSSQAYDSSMLATRNTQHALRHFSFPPWCRTQIVSPETGHEVAIGERGLIRVFDLANVFSVLAVQTEDLAILRGDGFELIGRSVAAEPRGCSLMITEARKS